jgi:hypothetical protein
MAAGINVESIEFGRISLGKNMQIDFSSEPSMPSISQISFAEFICKDLSFPAHANYLNWDEDDEADQTPQFVRAQYQPNQRQPAKKIDRILDPGVQAMGDQSPRLRAGRKR